MDFGFKLQSNSKLAKTEKQLDVTEFRSNWPFTSNALRLFGFDPHFVSTSSTPVRHKEAGQMETWQIIGHDGKCQLSNSRLERVVTEGA